MKTRSDISSALLASKRLFLFSNVVLFLLVGCGESQNEVAQKDLTTDPQVTAETSTSNELSAAQRDALANAKGRTWEAFGSHDLESFLVPQTDTTSAVFLWDPATGEDAIKAVEEQFEGLDTFGIRVLLAVPDGGQVKDERLALRLSETYLPAVRLQQAGDYAFITGGLPKVNSLIVTEANGDGPKTFSSKTPYKAYRSLLLAQAPKKVKK